MEKELDRNHPAYMGYGLDLSPRDWNALMEMHENPPDLPEDLLEAARLDDEVNGNIWEI